MQIVFIYIVLCIFHEADFVLRKLIKYYGWLHRFLSTWVSDRMLEWMPRFWHRKWHNLVQRYTIFCIHMHSRSWILFYFFDILIPKSFCFWKDKQQAGLRASAEGSPVVGSKVCHIYTGICSTIKCFVLKWDAFLVDFYLCNLWGRKSEELKYICDNVWFLFLDTS